MNDPTTPPPIDPSVAGSPAPDASWVPPWLTQPEPQPVAPPPPEEIQMPDDFVGTAPSSPAQTSAPASPSPSPIVTDVHPDAIPNAPPPWLAQAQHDANAPKLGAVDYALSQELGEPTSTGENAAKSLHQIATDPQASVADRQLAWKQLTTEDRTNIVNNADPKQLAAVATAAMSPEELATVAVRHQQAQVHQQSADTLTAAVLNDMQARREAAAYTQAVQLANQQTDAIAKDATALANTKIVTPNGVGITIGSILGSAIGGVAAKGAGIGGNPFMDGFNQGVERNIAIQRAQIENGWKGIDIRKNLVAEQFQRTGDMYRAQQVARIAHYDYAIKQAQILAQDYDPNGTTAITIAQQTQAIQAQRAAALQKTNDDYVKNHVELMKAQNEADTLKQTIKHQNAETAIAYGHLSVDRSKDARDQKAFDLENAPVTPEQARLENPGLPEAAYPTVPVSRKQLKTTLEAFKSGQELQGKATENAQKAASGQVLDGNGKPYVKDGKAVQINPEVAKDLNERIAGGQGYIDEMSIVKRMLADDPSTFDRKKWSDLNSHLETAAANWTQLYGAKASSRELEAAKEVVGADFSGYAARLKDKGTGIAAIGAQIDSTKRSLNTQLKRRAGITGGADLIDTSEPPPTVETPEDKLTKVLSTNYAKADLDAMDADDRAFVQVTKGVGNNPTLTAGLANDHFSPVLNRALQAGVAPAQLHALDELQAAVRGSDPDARSKALDILGAIAGVNNDQEGKRASATGANANVRAAAQAIIDQSSADSMTDTLKNALPASDIGTVTQTVHEEMP